MRQAFVRAALLLAALCTASFAQQTNLGPNATQIRGILQPINGGTGLDTQAATGCVKITGGTWAVSANFCPPTATAGTPNTVPGYIGANDSLVSTDQTVDDTGNFFSDPSFGSQFYASRWQNPSNTGNNGIAQAILANCNTINLPCPVQAEASYSTSELDGTGFFWTGDGPVNLVNSPSASSLWDLRFGSFRYASINPVGGPFGNAIDGTYEVSRSHAPAYTVGNDVTVFDANSTAFTFTDRLLAGTQDIRTDGVKYNNQGLSIFRESYSDAQDGCALCISVLKHGEGDAPAISVSVTTDGCYATDSNECAEYMRGGIFQNNIVPHYISGTLGSLASNGTRIFNFPNDGRVPYGPSASGRMIVDWNPAGVIFAGSISGVNVPSAGSYFNGTTASVRGVTNTSPSVWSGLGTSNWTLLTQNLDPPRNGSNLTFPAQNVSFTVANGSACNVNDVIILAGIGGWEYAKLTAVSGNTWTIAQLDHSFFSGSPIGCHGPVGMMFTLQAATQEPTPGYPLHVSMPVIGYDGTSILVATYGFESNLGGVNTPITSPTYTVTMAGGAVTGISHTGGTSFPPTLPPQTVLSGLTCTTPPMVHTVFSAYGVVPTSGTDVVDNPGSGCTGTASATLTYVYQPPTITPVMNGGGTALASITVSAGSQLGNIDVPAQLLLNGSGCTGQPQAHLTLGKITGTNTTTATGAVIDFAGACPAGTTVTATLVDSRPVGNSLLPWTNYTLAPAMQIQSTFDDVTKTNIITLEPAPTAPFVAGDFLESPQIPSVFISMDYARQLVEYNIDAVQGIRFGGIIRGRGLQGANWAMGIINQYTPVGTDAMPYTKGSLGYGTQSLAGLPWMGYIVAPGAYSQGFILTTPPQNSPFIGTAIFPTVVGVECNAEFSFNASEPCSDPNFDISDEKPFDFWAVRPNANGPNAGKDTHLLINEAAQTTTEFTWGTQVRSTTSAGLNTFPDITDAALAAGGQVCAATGGHLTIGSCSTGGVTSLNTLSGALTLAAGSNITITPSGSTLTIAATGGGGGGTDYYSTQGISGGCSAIAPAATCTGTIALPGAMPDAAYQVSCSASQGVSGSAVAFMFYGTYPTASGGTINVTYTNVGTTALAAGTVPGLNCHFHHN